MELREYQAKALADLRAEYGQGSGSALFVLPTGGGKTVVFSHVARAAAAKGNKVLVIVHRAELLTQTCRALSALEVAHGKVRGKGLDLDPPVIVASVQTMAKRLDKIPADTFGLIIVDEAHHTSAGTWAAVLRHFNAKVLGVTATPCRLDGRGLKDHYQSMVMGPTPAELTEWGFLARAKVYAPPLREFNRDQLRKALGDVNLHDAESMLMTREAVGDAVTHYKKHLNGGTMISFCVTVAHAEAVAAQYVAAGISAESIDGRMTDEQRESKLRRLGDGTLKVLTSCMLIGEGIDVPSVNGCQLLRPTDSLGLFLQMVGRCLRPSGDKVAIVLDHVGNYMKHGHHLMDREWTLDGAKRRDRDSVGVWECENCQACNPSGTRCCSECGFCREVEERKLETIDGDLAELKWTMEEQRRWQQRQHRQEQKACRTFDELCALGVKRGYRYPRAWASKIWHARSSHPFRNRLTV